MKCQYIVSLPACASEQGIVIGLVSVYNIIIYTMVAAVTAMV